MRTIGRVVAVTLVAVGVALAAAGGCASGGGSAAPTAAEPTTASPPTPEPTPEPERELPAAAAASVFEIVSTLAADELMGRDNQTEESALAQEFLVGQLAGIAEPAPEAGDQTDYRFEFETGTNLIGVIRGSDLADEYVLIGAHYDHIGTGCRGASSEDNICNGAADNAAGVAAAVQVARTFADEPPRRSVIVALWDSEEDGLLGARSYVSSPVVPLAQTVAYINFDIQGAHLSPALAGTTFAIGAETGGPALLDAVADAAAGGPLKTLGLSLVFGQDRSDHAPFAAADVPVVFFADSTNGCYHSVDDDLDALDFAKLDEQILTATRLAVDLANTDSPPEFDPDAAFTNFADAVSLQQLAATFEPDSELLGADGEIATQELLADLNEIVEAGEDESTGASMATILLGVAEFNERLANASCLPVAS